MKGYSTEFASAIALMLVSILKVFNIEITQSEVEPAIVGLVSVVAFANLVIKRFKRGGVTKLGFRK